jgi:hypothetical protein
MESEDTIMVPLLDISLSRWHAAGVSLVLTSAFFYSAILMKSAERLRDLKLKDLISRRYGVEGYHWTLFVPSTFTSSEDIGYLHRIGGVVRATTLVVMTAVSLLVPYFGILIGSKLHWSLAGIGMTASAVLLWCLALFTYHATPSASASRAEILKRIEE